MSHAFSKFSTVIADLVGRPVTFVLALAVVLVWALTGPLFGFSEVWQLVINTGTTIVTFLMIFVLQNTQNRDGKAIQAKLDELILTSSSAHNRFIGIEELDDREIKLLRQMIQTKACTEDDCENPELAAEKEKIAERIVDRTREELQKLEN
jgi:low affinity Fe/Cu permease